MTQYNVHFSARLPASGYVTVEANSREEAEEKVGPRTVTLNGIHATTQKTSN